MPSLARSYLWLAAPAALFLAFGAGLPRRALRAREGNDAEDRRAAGEAQSAHASPDPIASDSPTASFAHEIVPLLRRQGCSSAYCHGSATGRGGLKLSLFGSDRDADYHALVEELDGRRIDLVSPAESLLLEKATRSIAHGGGRRIEEASSEYQRVLAWIEAGAKTTASEDESLLDLALERSAGRVRAFARFRSAGGVTRRDVTTLSVFSSTDETIVRVERSGAIEILAPGEAWILASYAQAHARERIVTPFAPLEPPAADSDRADLDGGTRAFRAAGTSEDIAVLASTESAQSSPLDAPWREHLRALGLSPAPSAPAHTLARRLYLDLVARGPSLAELEAFLSAPAATRIERTARELLESREFAEVFAAHLADWFEVARPEDSERQNEDRDSALRARLLEHVESRRPLAALVEAALGEGPLAVLVRRFGDARDRAEFTGRAFLGLRLGCARCHNHPLDVWTQDDHLGFSACFTDPRPAAEGGTEEGRLFHPRSGAVIARRLLPLARALDTPEPAASAAAHPENDSGEELERSGAVARFILDPTHRRFARSVANRVFAVLLGRGLVEPLDDDRLSNPAISEPMLDALTDRFLASDTDLRDLVLAVVTSRVWALSSEPGSCTQLPGERETKLLARRAARPLAALTLERSLRFAIGAPPLPSPLGRSRLSRAPLARELALLNGPIIHEALSQRGTHLDLLVELSSSSRETIEELFQLALSRNPTADELAAFLPVLDESEDLRLAVRDLAFALFSSREAASLR